MNGTMESKQIKEFEDEEKNNNQAFYTSLNFNKMLREKKKKEEKLLEEEYQYNDPAERNIMNITHTWKIMEQKVQREIRTSKKISSKKPIM